MSSAFLEMELDWMMNFETICQKGKSKWFGCDKICFLGDASLQNMSKSKSLFSTYHMLCINVKCIDPDLCRNTMKYRNTHKRRDAAEIRLHFINNKWLKYAYRQNVNKLARALVAYLWEDMWRLLASELCYNDAQRTIIIEK